MMQDHRQVAESTLVAAHRLFGLKPVWQLILFKLARNEATSIDKAVTIAALSASPRRVSPKGRGALVALQNRGLVASHGRKGRMKWWLTSKGFQLQEILSSQEFREVHCVRE